MATGEGETVTDDFIWLRHDAREPTSTYTSYSRFSLLPACSFDWGADGYAGCSSFGGGLLYLSAPSQQRGLITVRGNFSTSTFATLSSTQFALGDPSTFGLEISKSVPMLDENPPARQLNFKLGKLIERGCFNHRWPLYEYDLNLEDASDPDSTQVQAGSCMILSFAKDGMFYQILRIEERPHENPQFQLPRQITLTMGGSVWFYSFNDIPNSDELPEDLIDMSRSYNDSTTMRLFDPKQRIGMEARLYFFQPDGRARQLPLIKSEDDELRVGRGLAPYTALVSLPSTKSRDSSITSSSRAATFMTCMRFYEDDEDRTERLWQWIPTSRELYDYVGVDPWNLAATGAMWDAIFVQQLKASPSVPELAEFNLIARCLEKILHVDTIPVNFDLDDYRYKATVIMSNRFSRPKVDLESLFWKIRFLVASYGFFFRNLKAYPQPSTGQADDLTVRWIEGQLNSIYSNIKNTIHYLVRAFCQPYNPNSKATILPDLHVPRDQTFFYITTAIWFVVKGMPGIEQEVEWPTDNKDHLLISNLLPMDSRGLDLSEKNIRLLLQWYHHLSITGLCQRGLFPLSWMQHRFEQTSEALARATIIASAAKLSAQQPYEPADETIDRLSFLAEELDHKELNFRGISLLTGLAIQRLGQREFTQRLNPGWLPKSQEGSISGPWEIYPLCHHSGLVALLLQQKARGNLGNKDAKVTGMEFYRKNILHFLNAEGTLVANWERAASYAHKDMLNSADTAIFASTLLAIYMEDMEITYLVANAGHHESENVADLSQAAVTQEIPSSEILLEGQRQVLKGRGDGIGSAPRIQWTDFSPPRQYIPMNFLTSLRTNPDLFQPSLFDQVNSRLTLGSLPRTYTKENLEDPSILKELFIYDIINTNSNHNAESFFEEMRCFAFQAWDSPYNSAMSWALYDSLANQGVQRRFLTVRKSELPKGLMGLLANVLHPESAACLSSHRLKLSRFSCERGDTWVASITLKSWQVSSDDQDGGVTTLESRNEAKMESENSTEAFAEDDTVRLPVELMQTLDEMVNGKSHPQIFQPKVFSIVLSTDSLGDFAKCTVVSEFVDPVKMQVITHEARIVWQKFVYQPQTARCLVFFLVLGATCQSMTQQYRSAASELTPLLKLDQTLQTKGQEQRKKTSPVSSYKLTLWSLEVLHKMQSSLNSSLPSILKAKSELMEQINSGSGIRSIALERMCQEYLAEFETCLVQLTAQSAEIDRNIEESTRNKEALSSVLAMIDSHTSITQNDSMRRLAYLTIIYLPLSLLAAIFAIPDTQRVVFDNMGIGWFIGGILLTSAVTYIMAVYIRDVLDILEPIWNFLLTSTGKIIKFICGFSECIKFHSDKHSEASKV